MNSRSFPWLLALSGLLAAHVVGGCPGLSGTQSPPPFAVAQNVQAETVVSNAANPYALAFAADGRVFYTEKTTGQIRVVSGGTLADFPFAAVPVNTAGERGLLGIALHPDFRQNGRVYVLYSRSDTGQNETDPQAIIDNRVVYFEADGDFASGGEVFVASLPTGDTADRIGGRIGFGRDGKLYVLLGDLGNPDAAQDPASPQGKLLRFNDDGSIPSDNPAADSAVFASGVRLGTGLAFDSLSAGIMLLDHNAGGNDELNRITGEANLGFPDVVGVAKTGSQLEFVDQNPTYVDPLLDSQTDAANPVGGGFNPSARYGQGVANDYFYGETDRRQVKRIALTDDRAGINDQSVFASEFPSRILDVAVTPAGTIYVACEDAVYRLAPID